MAHGNVYVCQIQGSKNYHNKMCSGVSKSPQGLNKYLTTRPKNGKKGMRVLLLKINHTFKTKFPEICSLIKLKYKLWHIQKC
jgi:hypothetical protein